MKNEKKTIVSIQIIIIISRRLNVNVQGNHYKIEIDVSVESLRYNVQSANYSIMEHLFTLIHFHAMSAR